MQFNFVNDSLRGEKQAGIKYKLGHITHGHHVTDINICKTLDLVKELVTWLVKRLALSQEMLSCLRACSTHSEGRVHSKLVEHGSVALEGVCTSKETSFKLCSPAIMNIIVHRCPYMVRSSNTYTVRVYIPQRRLLLNVLPPLGL